jgi:hypothetical protein
MKGVQGVIVAMGLGTVGALLNWAYLTGRSSQDAIVSFVGIKEGQAANRGEALRDEHLVELQIPERWVGNLRDFAVLWAAKETVIGRPVWRTLSGQCLLLSDDLKTPPEQLKLDEGEEIMWIPVESRAFVPALISPGDRVMFLVPRLTPALPGNIAGNSAAHSSAAKPGDDASQAEPGTTREMGPFQVRTLGNRLGSAQVWAAAKIPQLQENVIGISVKPREKKQAMALWDVLQATNFRQVGVEKLGPPSKPEPAP